MAVLRGDALGVELHAVDRMLDVHQAHDQAVLGGGDGREAGRQRLALDDQRVIAGAGEFVIEAAEDATAVVGDGRGLAVHQVRGADHPAAVGLADRLMAETDAEDRDVGAEPLDRLDADAGFGRRAGAGGEDDPLGIERGHLVDGDLVVAHDLHHRAFLADIVDEVEGEAVVIVDDQEHRAGLPLFRADTDSRGGRVCHGRRPVGRGDAPPRGGRAGRPGDPYTRPIAPERRARLGRT